MTGKKYSQKTFRKFTVEDMCWSSQEKTEVLVPPPEHPRVICLIRKQQDNKRICVQ